MQIAKAIQIANDALLLHRGHAMRPIEEVAFSAAWNDTTYEQAIEGTGFNLNTLETAVASHLWKALTQSLRTSEKITKKKLRAIFERMEVQPFRVYQDGRIVAPGLTLGGELPDTSCFFGRQAELKALAERVNSHRCILLTGAAGIGKTVLVGKLIEHLQAASTSEFEIYIWRSLHHAPTLQALLKDLLKLLQLSCQDEEDQVPLLLEFFRSHRCLLVLDGVETILKGNRNLLGGDPYGIFSNYGSFFRRLIEEQHGSCLFLTSRESFLESSSSAFAQVLVPGLSNGDVTTLLENFGLSGSPQGLQKLIGLCHGNPAALRLAARRVNEYFGGDLDLALRENFSLVGDWFIESIPYGSLSSTEKSILSSLSSSTKYLSLSDIISTIRRTNGSHTSSEILRALESLLSRGLVERASLSKESLFGPSPYIRRYFKMIEAKTDLYAAS